MNLARYQILWVLFTFYRRNIYLLTFDDWSAVVEALFAIYCFCMCEVAVYEQNVWLPYTYIRTQKYARTHKECCFIIKIDDRCRRIIKYDESIHFATSEVSYQRIHITHTHNHHYRIHHRSHHYQLIWTRLGNNNVCNINVNSAI